MRRCFAVATLFALALALLGISCSSRERAGRTTDSTHVAGSDETPSPRGEAPFQDPGSATDEPAAPLDTSSAVGGTLPELRERLRREANALQGAVASADFDRATARALRVRDLAVALSGRTSGLPQSKAQEIETLIGTLTEASERLRTHAAARETAAVRARATEVGTLVSRVVALTAD